jgi:hypothetical protein
MSEGNVRFCLGSPGSIHRCYCSGLTSRCNPLGEFGECVVDVHGLGPATGAGDRYSWVVVMPCAYGCVAGVAVLAARPGTSRCLHVHGRVITTQRHHFDPGCVVIQDCNGNVRRLPQASFALRDVCGYVLDPVDPCYSAERSRWGPWQGDRDSPGRGTGLRGLPLPTSGPSADRACKLASELLSVSSAPSRADLHDAHVRHRT